MRLRLLIEIDADADTIDALRVHVDKQSSIDVDLLDGYGPTWGILVGAVPIEEGDSARL